MMRVDGPFWICKMLNCAPSVSAKCSCYANSLISLQVD